MYFLERIYLGYILIFQIGIECFPATLQNFVIFSSLIDCSAKGDPYPADYCCLSFSATVDRDM